VPFDAAMVVEGYAALTTTVASWPEVVITANCALPLVEQPATNRVAIRKEKWAVARWESPDSRPPTMVAPERAELRRACNWSSEELTSDA